MRETERSAMPGVPVLLGALAAMGGLIYVFVKAVQAFQGPDPSVWMGGLLLAASLVGELAAILTLCGLFTVNPNEGVVLQLFGRYVGTVRDPGLRFANPFYSKHRVSLRVRNFESSKLKVNDLDGNPIEIGAVVVWKVVDTFEAMFEVDSYDDFVHVQAEAALRNLATHYPYDTHREGTVSLRGSTDVIVDKLKAEVQDRLAKAGVEVIEARITHLAYAPEIAGAMLRRQQANAVVAARAQIVDGAVGMVEHALDMLAKKQVVTLDDERRAAMVSNLLVVLCAEREAQPVVNTGTLYT